VSVSIVARLKFIHRERPPVPLKAAASGKKASAHQTCMVSEKIFRNRRLSDPVEQA
jgi:hypothetical protein